LPIRLAQVMRGYDYFGGIEYGMFDGSHRFECGR
jgi:hypothetical protein